MARPLLLPTLDRAVRFALGRRGLASRTVTTSLGVVHAYDGAGAGDLPTMCILHGFGSAASAFAPLLLRLQPHARRVVAPEMIGHGFSEIPREELDSERLFGAMREALDQLLPEPSVVLGNSLGGALALRYAVARPERVSALILVSPAGAPMEHHELGGVKRDFSFDTHHDARRFLGRLYARPKWFAPLLAPDVKAHFDQGHLRDFLQNARVEDAVSEEQVRALPMPVLFVWGKEERVLPASGLDFFKRALPAHAEVVEPEGFAHCPHVDDPERLARYVLDFARAGAKRA